MFGLGASEMILLGVVALIVIGPKDLPNLFRTLGQFTGKARAMASEFSRAMEAAADDSGVKDISKSIKAAANPTKFGLDSARDAMSGKKGPATQSLSADRQAAKDKISANAARVAEERRAREAALAEEDEDMADMMDDAPAIPPSSDAPPRVTENEAVKPAPAPAPETTDEKTST
ncbi:twin-arginine translocase subunit TatB [Salipiger sp. IMCC34102]|uniref:Sec-independent protein translocase subunit TatA/TatB n=1 Tax=Salipiger sp. IMCC34102 TaxID=2510647 RepID=UPI00101CF2A2|nr:twin-arginine translocase TatA/TatE family subunit [Salipiger sp. IMCC34102]RYH02780.1 twin-arginine translocase subunit TatB [Salipiger sp. IMCC34102]